MNRGEGGGVRGRGRGRDRGRGRGRGYNHRSTSGGPSHHRGRHHNTGRGRFIIDYRKLEHWSGLESEQLANELYGNAEQFGKVITKRNIRRDWVAFAIKILYKIAKASGPSMKKHIYEETFKTSTFWSQVIPNYLRQLRMYSAPIDDQLLTATHLYVIVRKLLEILPSVGRHIKFSDLVGFAQHVGNLNIENAVSLDKFPNGNFFTNFDIHKKTASSIHEK